MTNVSLLLVVSVAAFQIVQVGCGGQVETGSSEDQLGPGDRYEQNPEQEYGHGYGYGYGGYGYGYGYGGGY